MPHMDGIEATKTIRRNEGKNRQTPIVALSANILAEHIDSYLAAGMQACLSKPIKPQDLRQAVIDSYHQFNKEAKEDLM